MFAHGDIHDVYRVRYRHCRTVEWVLKDDSPSQPGECPRASCVGISSGKTRFSARNVATYLVDQHLGLNLVPETHFAKNGDRDAFVMRLCEGNTLLDRVSTRPITETELRHITKRQQRVRDCQDGFGQDSEEYLRSVDRFSAWVDDFGVAEDSESGEWQASITVLELTDTGSPTLIRGLCDLAWLDAVTGEVDRHLRNFLVKREGDGTIVDVVAIDNDFSFGPLYSGFQSAESLKLLENALTAGLPPVVTETTHGKLKRFIREWPNGNCRRALQEWLDEAEIAATDGRLEELERHLSGLHKTSRIIPDATWSNWRDDESGESAHQLLAAIPRGTVGLLAAATAQYRQRSELRA